MLKKRVIFTLLYDNGNFMLSRNFRLQKVGDMKWLKKKSNEDKKDGDKNNVNKILVCNNIILTKRTAQNFELGTI